MRVQYSLRFAFVIVLFLIAAFSLCGKAIQRWSQEGEDARHLSHIGARMVYERGVVVAIHVDGPLTPDVLSSLAAFAHLRQLRVQRAFIDGRASGVFRSISSLTSLTVTDCDIDWPEFTTLLLNSRITSLDMTGSRVLRQHESMQAAAHLEEWILNRTNVDDAFLAQSCVNRGLVRLAVVDTKVTGKGVCALGLLRNLRSLGFTSFSDEEIPCLAQFPALSSLDLRGSSVTDHGLEAMPRLENLATLHLSGLGITDDSVMRCIERLPSLDVLDLSDTKVSGTFLSALTQHSALERLSLMRTPVTSKELGCLKKLQIARLEIDGTSIGDDAISILGQCVSLRTLGIRQTRITDKGRLELGLQLRHTAIEW